MKVVVTSDWHIDDYAQHNVDPKSRLSLCLKAVEDHFIYAKENAIEHIIFGGDMFHKKYRVPNTVINATEQLFMRLSKQYKGVTLFYINGNHDHLEKNTVEQPSESSIRYLDDQFEFIKCFDNTSFEIDDVTFHGVPYYRVSSDLESAVSNIKRIKGKQVLIMHNTPEGIANDFIPTDFSFEGLKLQDFTKVFCGHIHKRQAINKTLQVIGSTMANSYMDTPEDKGFLVYDTATNKTKFVALDYPKFVTGAKSMKSENDYVRDEKIKQGNDPEVTLRDTPEAILKAFWSHNSEDKKLLKLGLKLIK